MTSTVHPAASPPGPVAGPVEFLSVLVRHFRTLERQFPQLELGESRWLMDDDEPADVEKGVLITYHANHGSGEVRAWVSPRRVKLKAHLASNHRLSKLEDRFGVTLGERPTWADREFDSLGEFAVALIDLMRRPLADLSPSSIPAEDAPSPTLEKPELIARTG